MLNLNELLETIEMLDSEEQTYTIIKVKPNQYKMIVDIK